MSRRKKLPDQFKNIIIVLLLFSAVVLGWQSQLFGNTSVNLSALVNPDGDKTAGSGSGVQAPDMNKTGEARPVSIAVTDSDGAHFGEKFDLVEMDNIYHDTAFIFGEALNTAQAPEQTDETAWREALGNPGIFYEYGAPMRLSVLDGWFGAEITGSWRALSVRRICVAVDGDPRLYFQADETGEFYAAGTEVLPESITKLTGLYAPNNAAFAFECLGAQELKDAYTLIMPDVTAHPVIEAKNPLTGETLTDVLRRFGVSEHLKPIIDEDGNQKHITADYTIELSQDGTVSCKRTGSPEEMPALVDESGAIELARLVVAESIGKYCGNHARVYFDTVSSDGPNSFRVLFTYIVAGGRVYMDGDGYAASVTVTNGSVGQMELRFRSFEITGQGSRLLPEILASAAAGGALMLYYADNGDGVLEPSWVVVSHNS